MCLLLFVSLLFILALLSIFIFFVIYLILSLHSHTYFISHIYALNFGSNEDPQAWIEILVSIIKNKTEYPEYLLSIIYSENSCNIFFVEFFSYSIYFIEFRINTFKHLVDEWIVLFNKKCFLNGPFRSI